MAASLQQSAGAAGLILRDRSPQLERCCQEATSHSSCSCNAIDNHEFTIIGSIDEQIRHSGHRFAMFRNLTLQLGWVGSLVT
jgi:hypothetical protein